MLTAAGCRFYCFISIENAPTHRHADADNACCVPDFSYHQPLTHSHAPLSWLGMPNASKVSCSNCIRMNGYTCVASPAVVVVNVRPTDDPHMSATTVHVPLYFVFFYLFICRFRCAFGFVLLFVSLAHAHRTGPAHKTDIHSKHSFSHRAVVKEWGSIVIWNVK